MSPYSSHGKRKSKALFTRTERERESDIPIQTDTNISMMNQINVFVHILKQNRFHNRSCFHVRFRSL